MLSIIRTGVGKVTTTNESIGEGWPGFLRTRFGPGHAALVAAINRPRPASAPPLGFAGGGALGLGLPYAFASYVRPRSFTPGD